MIVKNCEYDTTIAFYTMKARTYLRHVQDEGFDPFSRRGVERYLSGRRGFHLHVLDFDPSDWTEYNAANPIKTHEAARLIYTKYLKQVCGGFDDDHFKLSVNPMRVVTFLDSINGQTHAKPQTA
jgi:hypothetical protein